MPAIVTGVDFLYPVLVSHQNFPPLCTISTCSGSRYLKFGLMQISPFRSSSVHHQTPATDPETSFMPCFVPSPTSPHCGKSHHLALEHWFVPAIKGQLSPTWTLWSNLAQNHVLFKPPKCIKEDMHQDSFLCLEQGGGINFLWLSVRLSHWQSVNKASLFT